MLDHGGRIRQAAERYGIPVDRWLDLSTGINPESWPVPAISAQCWHRLPEPDDGLDVAIHQYYGVEPYQFQAVAGSQSAIQTLPSLRSKSRVTLLTPCYAEHAWAWQRNGHELHQVSVDQFAAWTWVERQMILDRSDVLIIINPNNPTGHRLSPQELLACHERLACRGGWLIVDEAFIDVTPSESIVSSVGVPGLFVLRSLGKYFGLAGARVGFVFGQENILQQMLELIGPWSIPGPSREIAKQALLDRCWQEQARFKLQRDSHRLEKLLAEKGLHSDGGTAFFRWLQHDNASDIHEHLARQGILTRYWHRDNSLRFGLPGIDSWHRLGLALEDLGTLVQQSDRPNRAEADVAVG